MKKLFSIRLEERSGEQEYYHDILIEATSLEQAERKANKVAQRWYDSYDGLPKKEDGGYYHRHNEIFVSVSFLEETTREEWCQKMYENALYI